LRIIEANQIFLLLSEYIQSILDCYGGLTKRDAEKVLASNFPLMEPRIQSLIKTASDYYGLTPNNPFEDDNIKLLFDTLGIQRKKKSIRAIKDIFRGSEVGDRRIDGQRLAQVDLPNRINANPLNAPAQNEDPRLMQQNNAPVAPQPEVNRPADRNQPNPVNPVNQAVME
jgi:hypothetical protein